MCWELCGNKVGKRWYVTQITKIKDEAIHVSFMTPRWGKWKWGKTKRSYGVISKDDVISILSPLNKVGNLLEGHKRRLM